MNATTEHTTGHATRHGSPPTRHTSAQQQDEHVLSSSVAG